MYGEEGVLFKYMGWSWTRIKIKESKACIQIKELVLGMHQNQGVYPVKMQTFT